MSDKTDTGVNFGLSLAEIYGRKGRRANDCSTFLSTFFMDSVSVELGCYSFN